MSTFSAFFDNNVKLLRLASSGIWGLLREVSSVDQAITQVGIAKVRTLPLASCFNDSFSVLPRRWTAPGCTTIIWHAIFSSACSSPHR